MLIPFFYLVKRYNVKITGILHVGAHVCEETKFYEKLVPRNRILWIEAFEDKVEECKTLYPGILIEQAVVSDKEEIIPFYRSNNVQSSSMFPLGTHNELYPHIEYVETLEVTTQLLKNIIPKYRIPFNFLTLDIQGAELKALKGMEHYLNMITYIYTEVNSDYVYENCCLVTELDEYLRKFGFERVETKWWGKDNWGDAFYIKNVPPPKQFRMSMVF